MVNIGEKGKATTQNSKATTVDGRKFLLCRSTSPVPGPSTIV